VEQEEEQRAVSSEQGAGATENLVYIRNIRGIILPETGRDCDWDWDGNSVSDLDLDLDSELILNASLGIWPRM